MTAAVVFDLNGTLSDDEPILCRIVCVLLAQADELIPELDLATVRRLLG